MSESNPNSNVVPIDMEMKEYKVPRNKPFTIPDKLGEGLIIFLKAVSLVPDDGRDFSYAVLPNKMFVPSFDKSLEDTVDIISWASRTPAGEAKIKISGEVNRVTGVVKIKGSGFEFVNIRVHWFKDTGGVDG